MDQEVVFLLSLKHHQLALVNIFQTEKGTVFQILTEKYHALVDSLKMDEEIVFGKKYLRIHRTTHLFQQLIKYSHLLQPQFHNLLTAHQVSILMDLETVLLHQCQ